MSKLTEMLAPGVVLMDDVQRLYDHARANQYALPAVNVCLLYTSPSPRDGLLSRMPSSA